MAYPIVANPLDMKKLPGAKASQSSITKSLLAPTSIVSGASAGVNSRVAFITSTTDRPSTFTSSTAFVFSLYSSISRRCQPDSISTQSS
ncbi:MAG: hypothetical protein ACD_75C02409G0003 [uncultured bacterium]|nr:MAG: hypothetical protein ACD_75C02409G0003 [uncultured bacterium]